MDPSEYARLRRLIVISWTLSLILGMILLYFGTRELANVKNAVNIQQTTLDENALKVDKLVERMDKISNSALDGKFKGDQGEKGDTGANGINGSNGKDGKDSVSKDTIIEKQSVEQVPVKGDKGDKGDQGDPGQDARQIELCKLAGPLVQALPLNIGWRYVGSQTCFEVEGSQ